MDWSDQVVVVTGVGAGMGAAMARRFAEVGARVVGVEVNEASGRQTMEPLGEPHELIVADLGNVEQVFGMVDEAVARCGRIDTIINNAGRTKSLGFFDVTEDDWDMIHSVNSKGLFFCMQAAAKHMAQRRSGRIINIASIAGKGYRGTSNIAYAGSKGAVIAMTRIGASQLARHNINVNAICPGVTKTALYQQVIDELVARTAISVEDAEARVNKSIPLRRANEPDDVADMALFLASDEARNVTGQSINVDGGLHWD
jgi:NAD(P)-dependent dehydrogenase (short-subunit alcohol dehydrogenase family)